MNKFSEAQYFNRPGTAALHASEPKTKHRQRRHYDCLPGTDKAKENALIAKIVQRKPRQDVPLKDQLFPKAIIESATNKNKRVGTSKKPSAT